jgi:hypothetical protein
LLRSAVICRTIDTVRVTTSRKRLLQHFFRIRLFNDVAMGDLTGRRRHFGVRL